MPITIESSTFAKELQRRRDAFRQPIEFVLKVPPELAWVYMQEHGTATRGDTPGSTYSIAPRGDKPLMWVDAQGKFNVRLFIANHPGIPAQHFIAQEQEEITKELAQVYARAVVESGWDFATVKSALLEEGMNGVKERIAAAIELHINKKSWRVGYGKLKDSTPVDEFKQGAYIEER